MKTQLWTAVSMYVLIAIVKKRLDLDASLYTLLQIFSGHPVRENPFKQGLSRHAKQF